MLPGDVLICPVAGEAYLIEANRRRGLALRDLISGEVLRFTHAELSASSAVFVPPTWHVLRGEELLA